MTGAALVKWAEAENRALIAEYSWAVRDPLDAANMPTAQLFIDDETVPKKSVERHIAAVLAPYQAVAQRFRGKLAFLYMKKVCSAPAASQLAFL